MKILVLNTGSSSLKYKLFDLESLKTLFSSMVENISEGGYNDAIDDMIETLHKRSIRSTKEIYVIGHRVVHGGERFFESVIIDEKIIKEIEQLIPLAPLHNPANLEGIVAMRALMPETPQVAVFDTAFHQTMPEYAYRYALPKDLYTKNMIRKYGFHGTSHSFVSKEAAKMIGKSIDEVNLITLHLGNGASMCAVKNGRSIDTSMGFTPLEGLIMGTRSGDIDPAVVVYLIRELGYTADKADEILNKKSGLVGLCGKNDMRIIHELIEMGDTDAMLSLDIFVYRIRKYIGSYVAVLGEVDALVFAGGIGENDQIVRDMVVKDLPFDIPAVVVKTDEELEIAHQTKIQILG